jgi:hypothetical protein
VVEIAMAYRTRLPRAVHSLFRPKEDTRCGYGHECYMLPQSNALLKVHLPSLYKRV